LATYRLTGEELCTPYSCVFHPIRDALYTDIMYIYLPQLHTSQLKILLT